MPLTLLALSGQDTGLFPKLILGPSCSLSSHLADSQRNVFTTLYRKKVQKPWPQTVLPDRGLDPCCFCLLWFHAPVSPSRLSCCCVSLLLFILWFLRLPLLLSWAINSLWRVGMQLRLALGGSCSFPLGEAQHEIPSAPQTSSFPPQPLQVPCFPHTVPTQQKRPGSPLKSLPLLSPACAAQGLVRAVAR